MMHRWFGHVAWLLFAPAAVGAADAAVAIRTDFPGGNVKVVANDGNVVRLAPDLRTGPAWFYWHFEAEATRPGRVTFTFADPPKLGVRGPAVSRDGGKTWQWLPADQTTFAPPAVAGGKPADRQDSFAFSFEAAKQAVRFAVAIPYLERDLETFLAKLSANPHLSKSVLTQSRLGRRPVELLQVGQPGAGIEAVLLTARHHACESVASYVLEGFIREAASESVAGQAFRKRFVLYAVPFVDKDGVEDGDQGKNRPPHDHNRDYGAEPIYPEVRAIQELAALRNVHHSLDLHCPFIRGDIHEAFHFLGLGVPHVKDNLDELINWLREERPPVAMVPLNLLADPKKPDPRINSHHFALREKSVIAATLEVPYAQRDCPLDAELARDYGASLVRAWVRTAFQTEPRGAKGYADLLAFRSAFQKTYRGKPAEAEQMARTCLDDAAAPAVYRAEANNLLATLRLQQRKYGEALKLSDAVAADPQATTAQRAAAALRRVQIVAGDPMSKAAAVDAALADAVRFPNASADHRARAFEAAGEFAFSAKDYAQALDYAKQQLAVAGPHDQGRLMNRTATLCDHLGRPADAVAARKAAVQNLRPKLNPVPVGGFGAFMANDLFEALLGIPDATLDERKQAAAVVLNHAAAPAALKEKVRKTLADLEKK